MSLIKWFRKNNKRLIAVFVVVLMFAFLMPTLLQRLARGRGGGVDKTIAYFGDDGEITYKQLVLSARNDLNILKMLRIDMLLSQQQDLRARLLGQLLFYEPKDAAMLNSQLKMALRQSPLRISPVQIDDFFRQRDNRAMPAELYWLLLKAEARQAGITAPLEGVKKELATIIPQLFEGASYGQVIGPIINRTSVPEDGILQVYTGLLDIITYSRMLTSTESVTSGQLMHNVGRQGEKLDVELVRFDASVFAPERIEPTADVLTENFEKYKGFLPGQVSEDNTYGFGYKLPEMVQLEYMAVKLDEVGDLVTPPSEEEKEEYYQANRSSFVYSEPLDPNDPGSEEVQHVYSYAEMTGRISRMMLRSKIETKAEMMLSEAKRLTEAEFENVEIEQLDNSEFRELAGDFAAASEAIGRKYNARLYTGRTGLLSAEDLLAEANLGMLYVVGQNRNPVALSQIVFSVSELGDSAFERLGPFEVSSPRMYENIGPMKDLTGKISVIVRVIGARPSSEPDDINYSDSKEPLSFDETGAEAKSTYSIKELVAEDVKLLESMATTGKKAAEFADLAQAKGWDEAIEEFNNRYHNKNSTDDNYDQSSFRLQSLTDIKVVSRLAMETYALHNAGNPALQVLISGRQKHKGFVDKLYSLVAKGKNSVENLPVILEYKPYKSFYVIKSLDRELASESQYEKAKAESAFMEDSVISQSLAFTHFSPENILARINYKPVVAEQQQKEEKPAEAPVEQ